MSAEERQKIFVQEYLIDLNAARAAVKAGYSEKAARQQGSRLLSDANVIKAVQQAQQARIIRTQITQDEVLRRWVDIATADARDLVEYRRCACRYCWGRDHLYQWRTEREFQEAIKNSGNSDIPLPSDAGGFGYTKRMGPNPECPECDGTGEGQMVMKDTRKLEGGAAMLYAGTNIGKDGLKVNMEDRAHALAQVAKHLGMLDAKVTLKGDQENPLELLLKQVQGSSLKPVATTDDSSE